MKNGNNAITKLKTLPTSKELARKNELNKTPYVITKHLNFYGHLALVFVYTFLVIGITTKMMKKEPSITANELKNFQREIHASITKEIQPELRDTIYDAVSLNNSNTRKSSEVSKLKNELKTELIKLRQEISELKNSKSKPAITQSITQDFVPAQNHEGKTPIVFNEVNERTLRFLHKAKYKKRKKELETEEALLLTKLDLNLSDDLEKWEQFKHMAEVELYKLKAEHYEIEKRFKKNQLTYVDYWPEGNS